MNNEPIEDRVLQIRRSHASARPKRENTAWWHTHNDLTIVLQYVDKLEAELARLARSGYNPPRL